MLWFYRLESGQNFDIQHNTFAHNENGYYLVNYINYYSSKIMSSAFINNTVRSDLIFLTQPNSYDNTFFKLIIALFIAIMRQIQHHLLILLADMY